MLTSAVRAITARAFSTGIVFNQSWEDPLMDRKALRVAADRDTVVSVTSGGCNCLNLLCLSPKKLICVDVNPAQTYLMDLKLAGIRRLDYDEFFDLFAGQRPRRPEVVYASTLRDALPPAARRFWDRNVRRLRNGLHRQGTLGLFLHLLRMGLRVTLGERTVREFFQVENLDEQREFFAARIAPRITRGLLPRILRSRLLIALAGMHPGQYELIAGRTGIERYVRERIEHLLTCVPVRTNYFLARAALGRYLDRENVPPYLLETNFSILKRNVDRVSNVTGWLDTCLDAVPEGSIDKFSLLDIFDWMDPQRFQATFLSIVRAGAEGGRLVYRSTVPFLPPPDAAASRLVGEDQLARDLLRTDRSGVYGSFYVYRVCKTAGRPSRQCGAVAVRE